MRSISVSLMCMDVNVENDISFLSSKSDYFHFDIIDNDFSLCEGLDPLLISDLRKQSSAKLDVHIMSKKPLKYIEFCIENKCEMITWHVESEVDTRYAIDLIHKNGLKAGLAIRPDTKIEKLYPFLDYTDLINVMLVYPGPAGQAFQKEELQKVVELKEIRNKKGYSFLIEIDGSCNESHYHSIDCAGPDICVVGTSGLFSLDKDLSAAWLKMENYMSQKTTIFMHADKVGNPLKEGIKTWLIKMGYEVVDLYTDGEMEYPECAKNLSSYVLGNEYNMGLLFCGTGLGMSIAANKVKGIRAAVVSDVYSAKMSRQHNDANVLCLGSRVIALEYGINIVEEFLKSNFLFGKHTPRVDRIQ